MARFDGPINIVVDIMITDYRPILEEDGSDLYAISWPLKTLAFSNLFL